MLRAGLRADMEGSRRDCEEPVPRDRREVLGARVAHAVGPRHGDPRQRRHPAAHPSDVPGELMLPISRNI